MKKWTFLIEKIFFIRKVDETQIFDQKFGLIYIPGRKEFTWTKPFPKPVSDLI